MSMKISRTRFTGVYTRESTERRHNGRPDVVFYYCLEIDGKRVWTTCGRRSEGMTAQAACRRRNEAPAKRRGLPTQVPRISYVCVPVRRELSLPCGPLLFGFLSGRGGDALHHRLQRLLVFLRYPACFHAGDHSVPQSVAKRGQKIPELPNRCGHAVRHGPFHLSDFRQTDENASAGPADDLQRCVAARGLHEGKRILIELVALCA